MNDRSLYTAPSQLSPRGAAEAPAPAPVDEDLRQDEGGEELDKYDISTLACTD